MYPLCSAPGGPPPRTGRWVGAGVGIAVPRRRTASFSLCLHGDDVGVFNLAVVCTLWDPVRLSFLSSTLRDEWEGGLHVCPVGCCRRFVFSQPGKEISGQFGRVEGLDEHTGSVALLGWSLHSYDVSRVVYFNIGCLLIRCISISLFGVEGGIIQRTFPMNNSRFAAWMWLCCF